LGNLPAKVEWPTVVVAAAVYGGWLAATWFHARLPWPVLVGLGGWLLAWHGSLQHEVIHGHPTPWRRVNLALALPPLSLWLPFEPYRDSHVAHHNFAHLTEPGRDPESYYLAAKPGWRGALAMQALRLEQNLLGRLALGPIIEPIRFWAAEVAAIAQGDRRRLRFVGQHIVLAAGVWAWLHFACHMSLGVYLLAFVYPGTALTLLRSFAEHRAHAEPARRTASVESAPILGLLFLNNNLHLAHHLRPEAPWYALPALHERERKRLAAMSGGLVYAGYADVVRRYLLRPHDAVSHDEAVAARGT
jgi:fatty acid desaturase